ncbi:MAG: hypothetical protein JHC33_11385 [Ignisphaera sp.]|nr:hypothetical protein [Ignisphaera sp.]
MGIQVTKSPIGVEDITLGLGIDYQPRGSITQFNAGHLPYTLSETVKTALDNRLTVLDSDAKYALVGGSSTQVFKCANGVFPTDAVNKSQLDVKANATELDLKAYKYDVLEKTNNIPFSPLSDYNPATKRYVDDSIYTKFQHAVSGTFISQDNKTVTVINGLITNITQG